MKNRIMKKMLSFALAFVLSSLLANAYFNFPLDNQYVSGITRIEFTLEEPAGIKEHQLFIDGEGVDTDCTFRESSYYRCVHFFDTRGKDGEHIIQTRYVNNNEEIILENITIVVNNEEISVFLDSPKEGDILSKNPLLEATVSPNADFVSFEYSRDNINWKKIGLVDSKSAELEWDVEYLGDGDYMVRAAAFNVMGAKAHSEQVTVTIERPSEKPIKIIYMVLAGTALIVVLLLIAIRFHRKREPEQKGALKHRAQKPAPNFGDMLLKAEQALKKNQVDAAKKLYNELREHYAGLPEKERKQALKRIKQLHARLSGKKD